MSVHPLTLFLGLSADEQDPRVLLDLHGTEPTRHDVLAALRSRLAQVAAHPRAQSAEASEVRLLLHAAAARELARADAPPTPVHVARAHPTSDGVPGVSAATFEEFQGAALLTLGMMGGWNRASLHRLKLLAISRGIPAQHIAGALATLTQRPWASGRATSRVAVHAGESRARASRASPADARVRAAVSSTSIREQDEPDSVRTLLRRAIIIAGLGVITLTAIGVALYVSSQNRRTTVHKVGDGQAVTGVLENGSGAGRAPTTRGAGEETSPTVAAPRRTPAQLVAALRDAALQVGPATEVALVNFERDFGELSDRWTELGTPELAGAIDATVEFLYRAVQRPESGQRAAEIIGRGASAFVTDATRTSWDAARVRRAVWCVGVLTRLLRERDLPPAARVGFDTRLRGVMGTGLSPAQGGFEDGVGLALARLPEVMLGGEPPPVLQAGVWEAYAQCAASGLSRDRAGRERLLLGLCERLMLYPLEPHEDAAVREGIRACIRGVEFSRAGPGRERVLAWLGRGDLSVSDLATVTSALIEGDRYKELDITMALSSRATELERAELLARFQSVWGSSGAAPRASVSKWIDRAKDELRASGDSGNRTPQDRLSVATRLATLNSGAARVFSGDASTLDNLLNTQQLGVSVMQGKGAEWDASRLNAPSAWAARYWSVGYDINKRRDLLSQAPLPPNGAEASILVRESLRGVPVSVRQDARKALSRVATDPTVLHALLDFAPFMPPTKESSELLESALGVHLPPPKSPAWRTEVRRALVLRMIEHVGGGDSGFVDLASEHLARQYEDSAVVLATPANPPGVVDGPLQAVVALRSVLTDHARRVVITPPGVPAPSQALARLGDSRRRADGDVQRFVVEQDAVVELLAAIVAMERPDAVEAIRNVLRQWDARRGAAWHVFTQIEAGERAQTALWIIRMGGEP